MKLYKTLMQSRCGLQRLEKELTFLKNWSVNTDVYSCPYKRNTEQLETIQIHYFSIRREIMLMHKILYVPCI